LNEGKRCDGDSSCGFRVGPAGPGGAVGTRVRRPGRGSGPAEAKPFFDSRAGAAAAPAPPARGRSALRATATPAAAAPGQAVAFDASSFRDPDSAITGYDWDFDGNGSVDRTTAGPTTSFAYAAAGTFAPRVAVKDFRGGAGTGSTAVKVTAPPPGGGGSDAPAALPVIAIARSGSNGRFTVRVTCASPCRVTGKVTVTKRLARKLERKRQTLTSVTRTVSSTQRRTITVKLSKSVLKALKQRKLKSGLVRARFVPTYADGRRKVATRTLRVRR
jgi:hypothetical protein